MLELTGKFTRGKMVKRLTERTGEGQVIPKMDMKNNGHQKCMERLAEYEELEEQGRLMILKFRPGDCVYESNRARNLTTKYEVSDIRYEKNGKIFYVWKLRSGVFSGLPGFSDEDVGKTVFLTQEEAETALEMCTKEMPCLECCDEWLEKEAEE